MAINIYSGGGGRPGANSASASTRAKAAKAALKREPSETSSTGNSAVGSKGVLGKVGGFIGKAAGIASKFLPGIGGTIAKGISNIFNDPEWWQSVPGEAITLNEPLRVTLDGTTDMITNYNGIGGNASASHAAYHGEFKAAILEITNVTVEDSRNVQQNPTDYNDLSQLPKFSVITPTEQQVTQYLMPEIRKVVNAVYLQSASSYKTALMANTTIYAIWRQLKKIDYLCKHGQTYLANMNDACFPLFQTENAAWLQSTINRLEEYLRANVRLPHTLCEYCSWRYGRVYKSNDSAKAALVLYNVLPITCDPDTFDYAIAKAMDAIGSVDAVQRANADIYNAYIDHDYMVEVRDDTQFKFDAKEFMLRLNLQGYSSRTGGDGVANAVAIDSKLDNPTAFMASVVSSIGRTTDGTFTALFPVSKNAMVYIPGTSIGSVALSYFCIPNEDGFYISGANSGKLVDPAVKATVNSTTGAVSIAGNASKSKVWNVGYIRFDVVGGSSIGSAAAWTANVLASALKQMILCKSVDMYNTGYLLPMYGEPSTATSSTTMTLLLDVTALSIDTGRPTLATIATEHVYAFANLCDITRKHSMSYKQAEHLVAKDTADLVETLDVATAGK